MKKYILILLTQVVFSQVAQNQNNIFYAKEFSKEISLYKAKSFVVDDLLGASNAVITNFIAI